MKRKIPVLGSAEGYDLAAEYYDRKEKFLNSFEQNKLLPLLGDIADKEVLDVGAGTGRLSMLLSHRGARVTALDLSPKMLELVRRKNKHIKIVVGDAERLPFADNSFDIVAAAFLIVHLKNPLQFFDEAYRVLRDGGLFVVTNINQKDPPKIETKKGEVVIESFYHRPEQVIETLEQLAFKIEQEIFINEKVTPETEVRGKEHWINQIIVARK